MSKQILLHIVWLVLFGNCLMAQEDALLNDPHYYTYYNPARMGLTQYVAVASYYQNKWPGMPSAFSEYNVSVLVPVYKIASNFGLDVNRNEYGNRSLVDNKIRLTYAYTLEISRKSNMLMGLSATYANYKVNTHRLIFEDDLVDQLLGQEEIFNAQSTSYMDFNLGLIWQYKENFTTGVALHHITKPIYYQGNQVSPKFLFYVRGFLPQISKFVLDKVSPEFFYSLSDNFHDFSMGSSVQKKNLFLSLHLNAFAYKKYAGINSSTLGVGLHMGKYNILYAYTVNFLANRYFLYNLSTHEVTFSYNFQYKRKKYAIK